MRVPLLDVKAQNAPLRGALLEAVTRVMDSGAFILGPEVEAFEKDLAAALGVARAIGVSSGTDALLVALMVLGVGQGDEVVTTPLSFFATVGCIARLGARPVFADIEPESFNLDPAAAAAACGAKTRAVIPVHLFGRPASLPRVNLPVVEDAAQSIGACKLGGIMSCLSFFPSKNLGAFGDGGAVLCDDAQMADKVVLLRAHGSRPKYVHQMVGGTFAWTLCRPPSCGSSCRSLPAGPRGGGQMPSDTAACSRPRQGFHPSCACHRTCPAISTISS